MNSKIFNRKASRIYLLLVPLLVVIFGFGIGKISYTFYLPIWIINVCLMVASAWILGLHVNNKKNEMRHLALGAFFLIVPWILISMFFGLGPPPETPAGWVETASEQQIRYFMLFVAGVFIASGFALLREKLKTEGENFYSLLGFVAIIIAIPLFIVNMLFWGFSLTELFKILVASNTENLPEWSKPIRALFGLISVVEVALTYIAIAAFAVSMKLAGWLSKTTSQIYVTISLLAFLIIVLSAFLPEPFLTAGFVLSIPAIPFLMPYFMGINLLQRAGDYSFRV
jgi:hypothetical protein